MSPRRRLKHAAGDRMCLDSAPPALCHWEMMEHDSLHRLARVTWIAAVAVRTQRRGFRAAEAAAENRRRLHPHRYSWTRNVVGDLPGYECVDPAGRDRRRRLSATARRHPEARRPRRHRHRIGHDDFIMPMLRASGNKKVVIIRPNETTPQIHALRGTSVNSHTFISFTNAIQQTYAIQKALAALRPQDAAALQRNASDYARRLRLIKAKAAQQLADAKITRVVTVHDGYGYLLQEFGLEVAGVVQPAHGLTPSAAELRDMVKLLQREKIRVVFSEETFPPQMLKVLQDEGA